MKNALLANITRPYYLKYFFYPYFWKVMNDTSIKITITAVYVVTKNENWVHALTNNYVG